jgi:hypothetical protein
VATKATTEKPRQTLGVKAAIFGMNSLQDRKRGALNRPLAAAFFGHEQGSQRSRVCDLYSCHRHNASRFIVQRAVADWRQNTWGRSVSASRWLYSFSSVSGFREPHEEKGTQLFLRPGLCDKSSVPFSFLEDALMSDEPPKNNREERLAP